MFFTRTPEDLLAFNEARRPDPSTGEPDLAKVGAFLADHPEFRTVSPAELLGEQRAATLGARADDVQLLPHRHGTDGFYIAGMRRR